MLVTKLKLAALALGMGLAVAGAGAVSYRALAGEALAPRAGAEPGPRKDTSAEARVRRIKKQIAGLREELSRAEEEAARQRAVPPRGPVAVIYGDVPITRDELAEHLLSRMRPEQLEGYINRRILEQACRKAGVAVTAEEVNDALKAELGKMNFSEKAFGDQLRAQHKTLREWKEDVLRPRLLMKKLAARGVRVTEKELRHAYEARYGEKVECEFLMWPAHQKEAACRAAERLQRNRECFDELAGQRVPASRVVAIGRQHDPERERLEKVVFALGPGEVSELIEVSGGFVLLKCRRRIPPETGIRFEDVREKLKGELEDRLRRQDTEALFRRLKAEARVRLLWKPVEERAP